MSESLLSGIFFFAGECLQGHQQSILFPRVNPRLLHQPQPLLHKKGLRTFSQTLFQSLEKGLTAPPVALTLR